MPSDVQFVTIHGYRRAFRMAGSGPALLLIHGLGCDSLTWDTVFDELAKTHTVIAPDLLGHGDSAKPDADYSVGGYANGMRDLLAVLGIERVTLVGHSFGGGVAMQFAYQFPEMVERLVLVSAGGLGKTVNPLIRALTVPGSGPALAALAAAPFQPIVAKGMEVLSRLPMSSTRDLDEVAKIYRRMNDPAARRAVQRLIRHVIDWRGQVVTALDRLYLAEGVPLLIIWGDHDSVVPVRHARKANAEFVVVDETGHFPHRDSPEVFLGLLSEFLGATTPAIHDEDSWRTSLRTGAGVAAGRQLLESVVS